MRTPRPFPRAFIRATQASLALLALLAAVAAQPAGTERSSRPQSALPPAKVLAELRAGGYVLYFRHAATDFNKDDGKMKSYEDCAGQRNLAERGRADARTVGAALRELHIPIGRVLASPFCRTLRNTALFRSLQFESMPRSAPSIVWQNSCTPMLSSS